MSIDVVEDVGQLGEGLQTGQLVGQFHSRHHTRFQGLHLFLIVAIAENAHSIEKGDIKHSSIHVLDEQIASALRVAVGHVDGGGQRRRQTDDLKDERI